MLGLLRTLAVCVPVLAMLPSTGMAASALCCLGDDDGPLIYTPDRVVDALAPKLPAPVLNLARNVGKTPTAAELAQLIAADSVPLVDLKGAFAAGTADLTETGRQDLGSLAEAIVRPELAPYRILVVAYAPDAALSKPTAQAVIDYLVGAYKIDASRLIPYGFGETHPLALSDDPAVENRRIQFVMVE